MPSSVVASMKYDAAHSTLRITYISGNIYDYKNVPPEVYEQMKSAGSKGTFLNKTIKKWFRFEKVK
jgi:hypothetical protein